MDRKALAFRPRAAELESKLMLSLAAATPPAAAEVSAGAMRCGVSTPAAVTSTIRGTYSSDGDNRAADGLLIVGMSGAGAVGGLGRANLSGSLAIGGMVADMNHLNGSLTLTTARGTLKLLLTAPDGPEAQLPGSQFAATVTGVKGTGAYRGIQRVGMASFQLGEDQPRYHKDHRPPGSTGPSPLGGTMTITLSLTPPPR